MNVLNKSILLLAICSALYGCSSEETEEMVLCEYEEGKYFCGASEIVDINDWVKEEESLLPSEVAELERNELSKGKDEFGNNHSFYKPENIIEDAQEIEVIKEIKSKVKRGDTFLTILNREGIPSQFFYNLNKKEQDYLVNIDVGDEIYFIVNETKNVLIKVTKQISQISSISLILDDATGDYSIEYEEGEMQRMLTPYVIEIKRSLYLDGIKQGLSQNIIANLQDTLSESFSFNRDLRKGDSISLMVEEFYHKGKRVGKQKLVGVILDSQKRGNITAIRHESIDGGASFYNENGESLITGFMRHPILSYKRISSRFNPYRKHPISGRVRPHNGTDYAASTGTPIYAASDGVVRMAKYNGGYGNVVYIDHSNGIQTRYAHMHSLSVKRGQKVSKGQIIGTVGSTGASTGPHLHYEYWVNSNAKDSLEISLPLSDSLKGNDLKEFNIFKSNMIAALSGSNLLASNSNEEEQ